MAYLITNTVKLSVKTRLFVNFQESDITTDFRITKFSTARYHLILHKKKSA